jgi:glycosyltransferase involved in cell wall biosynthesis
VKLARPPLRILQVNSLFNGGGTDRQTIELAAGLSRRGHEVILAVAEGSRWEALARRSVPAKVTTFPPKTPLKLGMIRELSRLLQSHAIQIVHAHQGRDYWPTILAARLARRNVQVVITRHLMTRPRAMSRNCLLSCAHVVAVSRAVQAVLARELRGPKERLHLVYGSIDPEQFQSCDADAIQQFRQTHGWKPTNLVFAAVGAFALPRGKGQMEFLGAAARVIRSFPEARFALIGSGDMEPILQERIASLGLNHCASIIPFTDDIAIAMNSLDVLVHPAVGTEALGLVILEALAAGKPVIASRLDGIPEALKEGVHGLLVPPADEDALAAAMKTLAGDPKLRMRFRQNGPGFVRDQFSTATQAENMERLYYEILSKPPKR